MRLYLDPGVTTGWARFDLKGKPQDFGQITGLDSLVKWLTMENKEIRLEEIVGEIYKLDNDKIFKDTRGNLRKTRLSYNELMGHEVTLKTVGAIECYCLLNNIPYRTVPRSAKKKGYAQSGLKPLPPHRHSESHQYDAIAIGYYDNVKAGRIRVSRIPLT